jgi:tRNA-2-methylthio-N6-dimethylallyladenosine synthase
MNVYDSEKIAAMLEPLPFKLTATLTQADLIIVNTCAIREKAEQKVYSFLGRLAELKRKKPDLIIGVGGCVAQQEGEKIMARMPHVDLVFGTHAVARLPRMIEQIMLKKYRIVDVEMSTGISELDIPANFPSDGKVSRFVTIMQGCDNFCTYCVVPYVRGGEKSRDPERIVKEISRLVESGVREVTLLGQNVNSYGKKEGLCSFPELLARINAIDGLCRIRFTTSHPKDLSMDLMQAFKEFEKLCHHIHLPVQSGSNHILKRMNRKYTRELYLDKVDKLRHICPDIAISSDFIVGFPGETELDFQETLDLIQRINYDSLFAFKYSDRPNAGAARLPKKVSEKAKKQRLQKLLELQSFFTTQNNLAQVGKIELILVEGLSKKQGEQAAKAGKRDTQWTGRTSTNKIVNFIQGDDDGFAGGESLTGKMVKVFIEKAFPHSLWGKTIDVKPKARGLKGEKSYAA